MGKADLHAHSCHTAWSDGNQTVEELFRFVEEETDLDLFAITDHDSTEAARVGWEVHQQGEFRFEFLPGVEVTNLSGHLLCYFPSGRIVDIPSLRPFWWTVRHAHEQGAICVVAHPVYPPWLSPSIVKGVARGEKLEGVEAINAGISERAGEQLTRIGSGLRDKVALLGNSDAHEASAIGSAFTTFPGQTVADFIAALENHTTEPVLVQRPIMDPEARSFTTRRSMTRPGWVRNVWRELGGTHKHRD